MVKITSKRSKSSKIKRGNRISRVPFKRLIIAAVLINIVVVVLVFLAQNILPPEIPLFYGLPRGNEQLSTSIALVIPSLVSLAIIIVNVSISVVVEDEFLKKVLVLSGVFGVFFSTITTLKIIFLVGSI